MVGHTDVDVHQGVHEVLEDKRVSVHNLSKVARAPVAVLVHPEIDDLHQLRLEVRLEDIRR